MSLKLCVLGSGSTGNCALAASESTAILIDMGLPVLRTEKCLKTLGVDPDRVSVLITHSHSDHLSGLERFCRRHPSVEAYCPRECYRSVRAKLPDCVRLRETEGDFYVGDVTVSPFKLSHDVPCVGYSLLSRGRKITFATDTGAFPLSLVERAGDSDIVVIESNHDEELVKDNAEYSEYLKRRILSERGHLSNALSAECVCKLAHSGVKQFVLAHLSRENNYPELAFETCKNRLLTDGLVEGRDVRLEVACPDKMSSLFEIE